MKTLSALLLLPVVLATAAPVAAQEANDERAKVRLVVESVAEFIQAKNIAGLDTLYASGRGVHIIEGAGVNHGWADYRDNHLKPELDVFEEFQYRYFAVEPVVRGTVAWAAFRYELSAKTPRGPVATEGRGTMVLEQRDGRWLIVHSHTSGRRRETGG